MSLVITNAGQQELLNILVSQFGVWYHLYSNDYTPDETSVLSDFTECTFPGYASKFVNTWTPAVFQTYAISWADQRTWTRTATGSPQQIYGYFVTLKQTTTILWAERRVFGPITVQLNGDTAVVLPQLTFGQLAI